MAQRKGGEADSYYNQASSGQDSGQYAPPPSMQYPPQAANNAYQGDSNPKYQQPPPNYGQNFQNPVPPPMAAGDGKQTFEQVFKLGTSPPIDAFLFDSLVWITEPCFWPGGSPAVLLRLVLHLHEIVFVPLFFPLFVR